VTKISLDVLIVNFNTSNLLGRVFSALRASDWVGDKRSLVVDNASVDDSVKNLRNNYPEAVLLANKDNIGFGRANNQLLPFLKGRYVLLLNTDAFVAPDTLTQTLKFMEAHPDCGVLGVRLVGRDGDLQPSCRYFPTPLNVFLSRTGLGQFFPWVRPIDDMAWDHSSVRECDWVPGCYYLIRREVIDTVGLFDPRFFLYYEEVDHCRRVKAAGWKVMYYPHTSVVHIGGESAKSAGELTSSGRQLSGLQIESELLYFRKHHGRVGLALHLLLVAMGDGYLALKALLKGQGSDALAACWAHCRLTCQLWWATRCATQPTR
jgi:N-acetylglucosaminyl-diphospho-decaprenol L-rhamnosyltransferase